MELKEPRRKKHCKLQNQLPLPLIKTASNEIYKFSGHFNGFSIIVTQEDEIKKLSTMGCFGKGNLSRGYPLFNKHENKPEITRKRIFDRRKEWDAKFSHSQKVRKVIVVPDSESENDDYFVNLKPEYQLNSSLIKEVLNLSLEEAFFLFDCIKCLNIYNNNTLLNQQSIWTLFCNSDKYFLQNYAVYYYFRSKNWVVKPGVKFGGDFLLYKEGPPFYHASYVVIIDILDSKTLQRREDLCCRSLDVMNVMGLNRLCETVGKELLICQLLWPKSLTNNVPQDVSKFSINEIVMRRWISTQNRELSE